MTPEQVKETVSRIEQDCRRLVVHLQECQKQNQSMRGNYTLHSQAITPLLARGMVDPQVGATPFVLTPEVQACITLMQENTAFQGEVLKLVTELANTVEDMQAHVEFLLQLDMGMAQLRAANNQPVMN